MAEEIEVPLEALIEKNRSPLFVAKGWIRSLKGHVSLTDEFKFKDDDALQIALHAQTTDKLVIMDSSGKFFNVAANEIPSGRGFGQPLRLMIDVANNDEVVSMFVLNRKPHI